MMRVEKILRISTQRPSRCRNILSQTRAYTDARECLIENAQPRLRRGFTTMRVEKF